MRKLRTDSIFPLAVLALLAGITFWLANALQQEPARRDGKTRHDPDFIVDNLTLRQMGKTGRLQYAMQASRMVHYPDDDSTEVTLPRLAYLEHEPVMRVSASTGTLSRDAKVVTLAGEVLAEREATPLRPALRVSTTELTVYPDEELAVTDKPVRIVQGASVITGVGMEADNRQATFLLKSKVHATIDRSKKNQANAN